MYKDLKEELKADIAAVRAGRRSNGTWWRRHMHLALCFLRGTPYRKCEADPDEAPDSGRVQRMLLDYNCEEATTVGEWMGHPPVPKPKRVARLYTVVRADLPPGAQAVQASHAMVEFNYDHPELSAEWHRTSNTVAILAVQNEEELAALARKLEGYGIKLSKFIEPDLGDSLTAVTFEPRASGLLKKLPLAMKDQPIAQRESNPPQPG